MSSSLRASTAGGCWCDWPVSPTETPRMRCAATSFSSTRKSCPPIDDPDEFYDHQLEGLRVVTTDGRLVGNVKEVLHTAAGELLSVTSETGAEILVPFVSAIVTEVSLDEPDHRDRSARGSSGAGLTHASSTW